MIDVSVIVPIYNTEKYVGICIESIQKQRSVNMEIIIINNGSTDNSLGIINNYANDDRIIIINLDANYGAAYARNIGISVARGKYLSFVDSDDWIEYDTYKILLEQSAKDSDIISYEFFYYFQDTKHCEQRYRSESVWGMEGKKYFYIATRNHTLRYEIATKLIKRDFAISHKLYFDENIIYEDTLFLFKAYLLANSVTHLSLPLYYYRQHLNSTMHSTNFEHRFFSEYIIILEMQEFISNYSYPTNILEEINNKINYEIESFKVLGEYDGIKYRSKTNKAYWAKLIVSKKINNEYKHIVVKENEYEKLRGYPSIYVCGLDYAALELIEQLEKNYIDIVGVLKEDNDDTSPNTFCGYRVIQYSKIPSKEIVTILLGCKRKKIESYRRQLYECGFIRIFSFTE